MSPSRVTVCLLLVALPALADTSPVSDAKLRAVAQNVRMCLAEKDAEGHGCLASGIGSNYHFYHLAQSKEWCGQPLPATIGDDFLRSNLAHNREPDTGVADVYGSIASFCVSGPTRNPEHVDRLKKVRRLVFSHDDKAPQAGRPAAGCPTFRYDEKGTLEIVSHGDETAFSACATDFLVNHL